MARLELPFNLDEVVCTREVSVVQSIEAGKLKACLQWIVEQLQHASPGKDAASQQDVTDLNKQNADLTAALSDLVKHQVRLASTPCQRA